MTKLIRNAAVLLLALIIAACSGGGKVTAFVPTPILPCAAPPTGTLPVITISDNINTATTWAAGSVYYVDRSISVNAPLTIQPGAVVKLKTGITGGTNITVYPGGSIAANGNSVGSIVFTSVKDDTVGGDTLGVAGAPAMGDWGKIVLNSSGSSFTCARFTYGGKTDATLQLGRYMTHSASITHSTFAHNNGANSSGVVGVVSSNPLDIFGALDASYGTAATVIVGNVFYDNKLPLSISGKFSLDDSNIFKDPANAGVTNKYNGIFLGDGGLTGITGSIIFSATKVPYVFAGTIDVPAGSALTLGGNVVVKFFNSASSLYTNLNALNASATITANATALQKIVFTSYRDDHHGGDTNGDGITTGAIGDWARVALNADGSIFNQCEFYYGGAHATYRETLNLNTYQARVTNSKFVKNHGGAIDAEAGALNASNAKAGTVITGNTFYNNHVPLTINGNISIDDSNMFKDSSGSIKNTYNGIFFTTSISKDIHTISLLETEVPFVMQGDLSVKTGSTLTTGDNVVLKFSGANTRLIFEVGYIQYIEGSNVKYTSIKDDILRGDTNGDGGVTSPAIGDWKGIGVPSGVAGIYIYPNLPGEYYCAGCPP